ncbi:hypothetical protein [Vannielia litorea]|uniref:hypothetical protein n=1 Tax=Vannielia litorea TaxID=1217970 RepID=UPI001BCD4C2A|nr:hypothetical protein [Vannielia litorea]
MSVAVKTIYHYVASGKFPAKWYAAFCGLAVERGVMPPDQGLFTFDPLPAAAGDEAAA